ncbi:hypothetical protein FRC08_003739 [Ceratobasidium sp. 394]|nr:hypothetical protein FRC08_003739 [Ceratobasidium sp. 394]
MRWCSNGAKFAKAFMKSATKEKVIRITHPEPGFPSINITILFYGSKDTPIAYLQDSKHAMKMLQNFLLTGTHLAIIGNCVICFEQILKLCSHPDSPIYRRDVIKIDRQDDHAALQLFSASFLRHVAQAISEDTSSDLISSASIHSGRNLVRLLVYLFVFGELVDAFQNHYLSISERTVMVLRAHFFLELWKRLLAALNYDEKQHFITREAEDIIGTLVHGYFSLIIIYRDHLDDENYPLCLWLHSTKPCKHTFGECRKQRPDFSFSDFVQMVPKLQVILLASMLTGDYEGDSKARAAGYYHTYTSSRGINIAALSKSVTNTDIDSAAKVALGEAKALIALCGIPASQAWYSPPGKTSLAIHPIANWYPDDSKSSPDHCLDDFEDPNCVPMTSTEEEESSAATELQHILENEHTHTLGLAKLDDEMDLYMAAAVALEVGSQNDIQQLPDHNTETNLKRIREHIASLLKASKVDICPVIVADEEDETYFTSSAAFKALNISALSTLREKHETAFAKKATRLGSKATNNEDPILDHPSNHPSAQQLLVKRMQTALREIEGEQAAGTGAIRKLHYGGQVSATGNAQNAAAAAQKRHTEALSQRSRIFRKEGLRCAQDISYAGVTVLAPIQAGSFAIVALDNQLWIAQVLTMYTKGGGKSGQYNWTASGTDIASVTYLGVRLWQHFHGNEFCAIVRESAQHYAHRFAHISWQSLMFVFTTHNNPPIRFLTEDRLEVLDRLMTKYWYPILDEKDSIFRGLKILSKRKKDNMEDSDSD